MTTLKGRQSTRWELVGKWLGGESGRSRVSLRATVLAAISCRRTNSVFGQRRPSRRTP